MSAAADRCQTGGPLVDAIVDAARFKGTGVWTVQTSVGLGVPVGGITEAVLERAISAKPDQRLPHPLVRRPVGAPDSRSAPLTDGGETMGRDVPTKKAPKRVGLRPVREVGLVVALYAAYSAVRLLASDDRAQATTHALDVVQVESWLHLDVEQTLNSGLGHLPVLALAGSYWYASLHFLLTPVVLFALYRRRPEVYARARTVLVLATLCALAGYLLLPTAPPRMLPGYTDTMATTSPSGWWGSDASAPRGLGAATNEFAAMPSMHVGWALWVTGVLLVLVHRPWQRILAVAYTPGTVLVVLATGNHWLLDAVAGAGLVAAAAVGTGTTATTRRTRVLHALRPRAFLVVRRRHRHAAAVQPAAP